jgi:hypothetical protein
VIVAYTSVNSNDDLFAYFEETDEGYLEFDQADHEPGVLSPRGRSMHVETERIVGTSRVVAIDGFAYSVAPRDIVFGGPRNKKSRETILGIDACPVASHKAFPQEIPTTIDVADDRCISFRKGVGLLRIGYEHVGLDGPIRRAASADMIAFDASL